MPKNVLVIEIGNSTLSAALFPMDWSTGSSPRLEITSVPTADILQKDDVLKKELAPFRGKAGAAVLASVVPDATSIAAAAVQSAAGTAPAIYRKDFPAGIDVQVDVPDSVGDDRLLNAIAAHARVKRSCVVVDVGSAITVDAVGDDGAFLGGAILPGFELMAEALAQTAQLPDVRGGFPTGVGLPEKDTVSAMRAGLACAAAGGIEKAVAELRDSLSEGAKEVPVVAGGGGAAALEPVIKFKWTRVNALTLEGLFIAWRAQA